MVAGDSIASRRREEEENSIIRTNCQGQFFRKCLFFFFGPDLLPYRRLD